MNEYLIYGVGAVAILAVAYFLFGKKDSSFSSHPAYAKQCAVDTAVGAIKAAAELPEKTEENQHLHEAAETVVEHAVKHVEDIHEGKE